MLKSNWKLKLLAMLLIFTLTFSDFALVSKVYAASILDGFKDEKGDTGSINVEFDSNLVLAEKKDKKISLDVNNQDLKLNVNLKVKENGYLKDGKVIIGKNNDANFKVNADNLQNDYIQEIKENEIILNQVDFDSDVNLEIPIYYLNQDYIDVDNLSKSSVIRLEGTYVDKEANNIKIEKDVEVKVVWNDQRNVEVSSELTKYIPYKSESGDGVILQTLVKVNGLTDKNTLPVKSSALEIEVPNMGEVKPQKINVVAKSTENIDGKANDEVIFLDENWTYDAETNILNIKVQNQLQKVVLENEDEVLKHEDAPELNLYYSKSGVDEFLITYTYSNVDNSNLVNSSKIKNVITMFDGESTKIENQVELAYELTEQVGDIVTYTVENSTDSITKAYTYLNYNNEENKYEIELDSKLVFNISYKDIVQGLYFNDLNSEYIKSNDEKVSTEDFYYKTLIVNGENFNTILGEDGFIKVTDEFGNLHASLDKNFPKTEEGNYEIIFDESVKKINIETSAPISEGNLIVSVKKGLRDTEFSKDEYKDFKQLQINSKATAKYTYVNEVVDCGNANVIVNLEDTKTNATLKLSKENLSTLAMNDDVEMRIEFNNDKEYSDVYGTSEFIIKVPSYIEEIEVLDASLVYDEGLELKGVEVYNEDSNTYIRAVIDGKQNQLSSGIITNGTNIVMNTNMKANLYTPAIEDKFELTYVNSEVTAYENNQNGNGYNECLINYSAPSGVVTVNSIKGYSDLDSWITSVNQGIQKGNLPIYSESKLATMEITVMNNEENAVSNVAFLGRLPFVGVKDIITNEELGTTIDAKMASGLETSPETLNEFTIYYSENGEATKDLLDENNGWTTDVQNFALIKSYLIVPNNPEYQMPKSEVIRFTYQFIIPENLAHNNDVLGTVATYYTNVSEVATLDEISIADFVILTTGAGPELEITSSVNDKEINEFEEITITSNVKNIGKEVAKNVEVEFPLPLYSTFKNVVPDSEGYKYKYSTDTVTFMIPELKQGEELELGIVVKFDKLLNDVDGIIASEAYAKTTCTDLGIVLETAKEEIKITQAELTVKMTSDLLTDIVEIDKEIVFDVTIRNYKEESLTNVKAKMQLDNNFKFQEAYLVGFEEDGITPRKIDVASYDKDTRTVTWKLDEIQANEIKQLRVQVKVTDLEGSELVKQVENQVKVTTDQTGEYKSEIFNIRIGKTNLVITQTTETTNTYVKEGEVINYKFNILNEGSVPTDTIRLTDRIPEGLVVRNVSYNLNGVNVKKQLAKKDEAVIAVSLEPGQDVDVNITALAKSLKGSQELSVTNVGELADKDGNKIQSNSITHIVEAKEEKETDKDVQESTGQASSSTEITDDIRKTYKVQGVAWLDSNNNGMRDQDEKLMKNIKATLVNSETGYIKQSVKTNSAGEYMFTGVENGNYIVIFDYDTVLYTVTVYQKENVPSNVNSDVITTKIEENGKLRNGAVTGNITVRDGSVANIDIGFVEALKFDLSLKKEITKMIVNNKQGNKTYNFDKESYAKVDITAKHVAGSKVYIEYLFTVKNEGEVSGYAKKIVDYLPEDVVFNSQLNPVWYTGSDGNLYTTTLAEQEIKPGETKQFKLVLEKNMTAENTGVLVNTAEIVEDYNIYGISDKDSTPDNKAQNEDDFGRANAIISVKTGEAFIYTSVIIMTMLLIGIAVFIVVIKIRTRLPKGGV